MSAGVLVIDDSKTVRRQVLEILQSQSIFSRFFEAGSAIEGFKLVLFQPVDVILCDLEMPGMDGFKFLEMIKAREDVRDIPIILLTGHDNLEAKINALEQGASDYVTKPFEAGELLARIKVQLKVKMLQDNLKRSNQLLHEMSITDSLTGLYNHRYLMETMKKELKRSLRTKTPLSLVMADIDHFKKINDTHGHQQGDAVLVSVARALGDQLRPYDIVARFGGEEFALIFPDTAGTLAWQIAERQRLAIRNLSFPEIDGNLRVTISMGLTTLPRGEIRGVDDLIREADEALYRAKWGGRNRVEMKRGPDQNFSKQNSQS
jgi:two-component system, cell cycle response regulator